MHARLIIPLLLCASSLALTSPAFAQQADTSTIVIVIRHAEKAAGNDGDPSLSAAGIARTKALIDALKDADVKAVYTTQYRRTHQTGEAVAALRGITITELAITDANAESYGQLIANDILAKHRGETVLVVGHSNTVPAIVQALSGREGEALSESQYDRLFIVVISKQGTGRVIAARYGAATP